MKYILWPIFATLVVLIMLFAGIMRLIFIPLWHFRLISIKEAYTLDGGYLFDNWSWKEFFRELVMSPSKEDEEDNQEEDED